MAMNPRLLRPLATGFSPRQISGLALWLDAADSSTITLNGSTVSEWLDKSGNGRNARQPTAARQPEYNSTLNGLPVVTTSNSVPSNIFASDLPAASAITIFAVIKRLGAASRFISLGPTFANEFIVAGTTGWIPLFGPTINTSAGHANGGNRSFLPGGFLADESAVVTLTHSGSAILNYKNGVAGSADSSVVGLHSPFARLWVGGRSDAAVDSASQAVGEVIFYSRILSLGERQRVERYLGRKWGITVA